MTKRQEKINMVAITCAKKGVTDRHEMARLSAELANEYVHTGMHLGFVYLWRYLDKLSPRSRDLFWAAAEKEARRWLAS